MKFHTNGLLVASALVAAAGAPPALSYSWRFLLIGAACAFSVCLIFYDRWVRRLCTVGQLTRIDNSNILSLTLIVIPVAVRCAHGTWINLLCDSAAYAGCVCLVAFGGAARIDPLLHRARFKFQRALPILFYASCVIYTVLVGLQAVSYYNAYSTEWVDFSFGFPPVWQNLHYGLFRMVNEFSKETTELCLHWPLIYLLISPVTFVCKSPTSVLWIQTFFFTASAYAVYLLANYHLKNVRQSYCLGVLFLVYLPVHLANLFDFHADPLAMPFIFLSFLYAAKENWTKYWICIAASLCCIEYAGIAIAGYGIWLSKKNKKNGIATIVVGLFWFFFVLKLGIPLVNKGLQPIVIDQNYGDIGGSGGLLTMVSFVFTHPLIVLAKFFRQSNIVAMMSLLLPFLFLSLRKPWILAAGSLVIIKNALSGSGLELLSHRETLFVPFVVYAFILFIAGKNDNALKRYYLIAVTIAIGVTFLLQGHAFPARGFWNLRQSYIKSSHDKKCDRILDKIPDTSAVMSSSHIAPHLMARRWYFLFPRFPTPVKPEYIVIDTLEQAGWDWLTREEHQKGFRRMQESKDYNLIENDDGIFLFKIRR